MRITDFPQGKLSIYSHFFLGGGGKWKEGSGGAGGFCYMAIFPLEILQ